MPISVNNLAAKKADCTVRWQGEEAKITYRPGLVTAEKLELMGDDDYGLQRLLSELIVSWDVMAAPNGKAKPKPYPTTVESLKGLPSPFLRACLRTMLEEAGDVGEADGTSNAG